MRAKAAFTVNLSAGCALGNHWQTKGEAFNLLNRKNQDVACCYESQLPGEGAPVADVRLHPAEPSSFRLGVTGKF